jgi:hypothetical protein
LEGVEMENQITIKLNGISAIAPSTAARILTAIGKFESKATNGKYARKKEEPSNIMLIACEKGCLCLILEDVSMFFITHPDCIVSIGQLLVAILSLRKMQIMGTRPDANNHGIVIDGDGNVVTIGISENNFGLTVKGNNNKVSLGANHVDDLSNVAISILESISEEPKVTDLAIEVDANNGGGSLIRF